MEVANAGASHSLCFRATEEAMFNQMFSTRCHQDGTMDLTQFIILCVERDMVSNKFSLDIFYTAFKEAAMNCGIDAGQNMDIDNKYVLINNNFYLAMTNLAKALYAHEENPFEAMFTKMLVDSKECTDNRLTSGRSPKMGENTVNILSEESIKVYLTYMWPLKNLFKTFIHQNANSERNVLRQRDIEDQNTQMKVSAFLKMLKKKEIIPLCLNIESLQQQIKQCITPMTNDEHEYLIEKKMLFEVYRNDNNPDSHIEPQPGEPGLLFHEFIFLLAMIASSTESLSPIPSEQIEKFFTLKLHFDQVPHEGREYKPFDWYLEKAQLRAAGLRPEPEDASDDDIFSDNEEDDDMDRFEIDEKQKQFKQFLEQKAMEEANFHIDFDEVLDMLEDRLPMIPGKPQVQQFNPPPYKLNPKDNTHVLITFGKLYPRDDDGKKKKKAAAKAAPRKKDEKPRKPTKWRGPYVPEPPDTMELLNQAAKEMQENVFPMHLRGDQQNPSIMPSIIKEVFFPPEAPHEVATLIESALVYQNSANYQMAVRSLEEAREMWRTIQNPPQLQQQQNSSPAKKPVSSFNRAGSPDKEAQKEAKPEDNRLRPEQELFFLMSLGSVYESGGKDEIAISCYMNAITEIELEYNHPDQAFPYCGLGSVFYHIDEPAWALRCFLKAREIRELRLGGDTVDTATVYNNLGCCMYLLERNQESKAYYELANAIMDAELGPQHERTLTTKRNLLKADRTFLDIKPEFRQLWETAMYHPCPPAGKKGKKKKGKKKK